MTISLNLRLAVASHYNEEARSRWLASSDIEWETLAQEAIVNRLAPLLYDSLQKFPRHDVPNTILESLQTVYYATAARNAQMHEQLKKVTDALDEIGVRYILLKGAALIQDVYDGNMALRPMSDIDILIDSVDLLKTLKSINQFANIPPLMFEEYTGAGSHAVTCYLEQNTTIEIHTRLLKSQFYIGKPPFDSIVHNSYPHLTPSSNWQFIHLCSHAYFNHRATLSHWGIDGAFAAQAVKDWNSIITLARTNDMVTPLQWGINHLRQYWFVSIPNKVVSIISDLHASYLEHFHAYCMHHAILRRLGQFIAIPSLQLKAKYLKANMFPSRAYLNYKWGEDEQLTLGQLYLKRFMSIPQRLNNNTIGIKFL